MTILDQVLQEEYDRLSRMLSVMEAQRAELPEGYISTKKINGKEYHYLQKRVGGRITGSYIQKDQLEAIRSGIDKRKMLEKSISECRTEMKKLEKVI